MHCAPCSAVGCHSAAVLASASRQHAFSMSIEPKPAAARATTALKAATPGSDITEDKIAAAPGSYYLNLATLMAITWMWALQTPSVRYMYNTVAHAPPGTKSSDSLFLSVALCVASTHCRRLLFQKIKADNSHDKHRLVKQSLQVLRLKSHGALQTTRRCCNLLTLLTHCALLLLCSHSGCHECWRSSGSAGDSAHCRALSKQQHQ